MDRVTVLVTAAGASVIEGTVYSLKNNPDKLEIKIIGVDEQENVAGRYFCDKFFKVPKNLDESYVNAILDVCKKENVDVILPTWSDELSLLSENRKKFEDNGIRLALSDIKSLNISNNKFELFTLCKNSDIPVPESYLVSNFNDLSLKAKVLGYPEKKVVIKRPDSSGERGFRVLSASSDRKKDFYTKKPQSSYITLEELHSILGESFPHLIISEFLPGKEYTVDCFRNKEAFIAIPRTRDFVKLGISFEGTLENNDEIMRYSKMIAEALDLEYCFGFQFKLDSEGVPKIIEANPRVQGATVTSTFGGANLIYASIKHALGEKVELCQPDWGSKILRYFGTIGVDSEGNFTSASKEVFRD